MTQQAGASSVRTAVQASSLLVAVFALSLAGYPIAGILASALDVSSTTTSIPFRILVVFMAGLLAALSLKGSRIGAPGFALLVVLALYLVRLVWDFGADRPGVERSLSMYIAVVLVPTGAALLAARHWSDELAARSLFALAALVSAAVLLLNYLGLEGDRDLTEATGRLSFDTLNPITIGHVGVSGALAAIVLATKRPTLMRSFGLLGGAAASLAAVAESGSKGPLLALVLAVALLTATGHVRPWLPVLAMVVAALILPFGEAGLTERIAHVSDDPSTAIRFQLLADTLRQISFAPLVGSAYVELQSGDYPHNILVEALMALGIPMGALFGALIAWVVWRLLVTRAANTPLLAAVFCQYLVGALLSGSLFASVSFWLPLALLCIRLNVRPLQNGPRTDEDDVSAGFERPASRK